MNSFKENITGLFLCATVFAAANVASAVTSAVFITDQKSPIPSVMFAVIIGILIKNTLKPNQHFHAGINFSLKYLLRLGIILLGFRIGLGEMFVYSALAVPLVAACILTVLIVIKFVSQRLNVSSKMSYLIAIGTSICGASAIIALAPVINAKKGEITYAIANIVLFGLIGMFLYPSLAETLFEGNQKAIGLFLGTAIHDTAQVAASGLIYEQQFPGSNALEVATVTKLVRNTFLLLLIPTFAYAYMRDNQQDTYSIKQIFPLFVIGFIFMVACRTAGDEFISSGLSPISEFQWHYLIYLIEVSSGICLGLAMASLGLSTDLKELRSVGYQPFLVGLLAAAAIGLTSLMTITLYLNLQYLS